MRHNWLKLVVGEDSAKATGGSTELSVVPPTPDCSVQRLRGVDADEGPNPDDAA